MMVHLDANGLKALAEHAAKIGTLDRFAPLAVEWAGKAEAHIRELEEKIDALEKNSGLSAGSEEEVRQEREPSRLEAVILAELRRHYSEGIEETVARKIAELRGVGLAREAVAHIREYATTIEKKTADPHTGFRSSANAEIHVNAKAILDLVGRLPQGES